MKSHVEDVIHTKGFYLRMNGNGVKGIKDGADMALQLECETRDPAVSVVGPLPPELHAWLDGDVAVSSRSADPGCEANPASISRLDILCWRITG